MSRTADVVVVGAGIVGAACADALAAEGLTVAIVEPGAIGGGATASGMGHIVVMDDSEPQFALTNYSRSLWDRLSASLPDDVEFDRCGTLWVAADEDEMAAVRSKHEYYGSRGVRAEILDGRALADAEPNLRAGLHGALRIPDDIVIYAPCAARWLVERSGARVWTSEAASIGSRGVVLADGTRLSAGAVICSAGAWVSRLFPSLAVRPRKGHLAITDRYSGFVRHQLVELGYLKSAHGHSNESVAFNVQPRRTGQLLIGSSRQYGQTEGRVENAMLTRMLRRAVEYLPGLASLAVIRAWTGFRAATPDSLPLIGECPGRRNVYLAAGHEGLGITTSLGTARLLCDRILGRAPAIDDAPYRPERIAAHA